MEPTNRTSVKGFDDSLGSFFIVEDEGCQSQGSSVVVAGESDIFDCTIDAAHVHDGCFIKNERKVHHVDFKLASLVNRRFFWNRFRRVIIVLACEKYVRVVVFVLAKKRWVLVDVLPANVLIGAILRLILRGGSRVGSRFEGRAIEAVVMAVVPTHVTFEALQRSRKAWVARWLVMHARVDRLSEVTRMDIWISR